MNYIKNNPKKLTEIDFSAIDTMFEILNLNIVELDKNFFKDVSKIISKYKLLTNDTIHVLTMKYHSLINIATNDTDFERVGFLKVWKP